ncbi:MAG: hypothetical protein ACFFDU_01495 [Candidatus Thorarchaeota archaeon]
MTQNAVDVSSEDSISDIQRILHQHNFVALPARADGTQLAVRNYDTQGLVRCDLLVFREINETSKALRKEATRLIQALSELQTELPDNPRHLNSTFQSHAIRLCGKKAQVLTDQVGQPLYCQIIPLLLYPPGVYLPSIHERATAYPAQVLPQNQMNEYLNQNLSPQLCQTKTPHKRIQYLRKSFRMLGLSFLFLPLLIGLTGIFLAFTLLLPALFTILLCILEPVLLLRKALSFFNKFKLHTAIPILTTKPISAHLKASKIQIGNPPSREVNQCN